MQKDKKYTMQKKFCLDIISSVASSLAKDWDTVAAGV